MNDPVRYRWSAGDAYERYVGRWSRAVATEFAAWLALPRGARCADVGAGTGALGSLLLASGAGSLLALDRSSGYLAGARTRLNDRNARFAVADAQALPVRDDRVDAAVSGLVINFVPEPRRMLDEMVRVTRRGGTVAVYVWDYAGRCEPIRFFWDAAVALDAAALALDEGRRFPLCHPATLGALFEQASLENIEVRAIDVPAVFRDFDDYWEPFLSGEGPAPGYCVGLAEERRTALRESLRRLLPAGPDGAIALTARAWAARGVRG